MSTADKLAKVLETKLNIKQAITEKGVSVLDTDTFATYPDKIRAISGGGTGGGGTKIYANNILNEEFVKGEKVLLVFNSGVVNIYKDNADYFEAVTSFTGFITGNVDNFGRYEVETILPEKVDLKIVTNVDVKDDEIIFEGAI